MFHVKPSVMLSGLPDNQSTVARKTRVTSVRIPSPSSTTEMSMR
jgi:hypothetical protein